MLLDVRTPEEFSKGHVPGAINIPVDELRDRLGEIPARARILCYCQVGQRGYLATRILLQRGFDGANLGGGWKTYRLHRPSSAIEPSPLIGVPRMHDVTVHLGRFLRLDDNPLLAAATETHDRLLPVFALDPAVQRGVYQEAFLLASLADLQQSLRARGSDLLLLREAPPADMRQRYECPMRMIADGDLPFLPSAMPRTYTPFRQRVEAAGTRFTPPITSPERIPPLPEGTACPTIDVPAVPLIAPGGASAGLAHWRQYRDRRLPDTYKQTRNDLLGWDASSKLSIWLAWGCLSPRRLAFDLAEYEQAYGANEGTYWLWFELLWRDFFSFRADQRGGDGEGIDADDPRWQDLAAARLGNPLIDAGLRELNATGFLGNRMRQIVASFLIHERGWPWAIGAAYFAAQLIDHDPASNIGNWRYIAGQGADPRGGRRFNLEKQREMYDPANAYARYWNG